MAEKIKTATVSHRRRLKDKISHNIKKNMAKQEPQAQNLQRWEFHCSAHDYSNVSVSLFDQVSIRSHRP